MKIERKLTLSSYEAQEHGIGHTIDGKPPVNPSFAESISPIHEMIKVFKRFPTGTIIKITMETAE